MGEVQARTRQHPGGDNPRPAQGQQLRPHALPRQHPQRAGRRLRAAPGGHARMDVLAAAARHGLVPTDRLGRLQPQRPTAVRQVQQPRYRRAQSADLLLRLHHGRGEHARRHGQLQRPGGHGRTVLRRLHHRHAHQVCHVGQSRRLVRSLQDQYLRRGRLYGIPLPLLRQADTGRGHAGRTLLHCPRLRTRGVQHRADHHQPHHPSLQGDERRDSHTLRGGGEQQRRFYPADEQHPLPALRRQGHQRHDGQRREAYRIARRDGGQRHHLRGHGHLHEHPVRPLCQRQVMGTARRRIIRGFRRADDVDGDITNH